METIEICGRKIPVVAQRHARLRHLLKAEDFQAILGADYSREAYRVLGVLIPALPDAVPEHEWEGFASREAMDADDYDEAHDTSPTPAEIIAAFEMAVKVNGGGRLGKIVELVQAGQGLAKLNAEAMAGSTTPGSPGSPGANGESPSTSTGPSSPVSIESAD